MQWVPCCVICCIALITGADTEVQGNAGWTPLMYACSTGHKDVVAHLLEHGEQLHFCWHAVLIFYDEKKKAKSLNCARVRSHVVVPTHLLHERCNLTC